MWTVVRQVCFQDKQRRHCLAFHPGEATLAWYAPKLQEARQVRERAPQPCWLMDKHAASADRVVNMDEMSCRLLPVHQTAT